MRASRIVVDGASPERCFRIPPGADAARIVGPPMRESHKQTGVKYAQFSAVGFSNMLVEVGVLNLLLLVSPTRSPELLLVYNVGALSWPTPTATCGTSCGPSKTRTATTPSRWACSPPSVC